MVQPKHPTLINLPTEIPSERLVLRPYRPEDGDALFAAIEESREHLRPWLGWAEHYGSAEEARVYCARCAANWLLRTDLTLGIFDRRTGKYFGGTGLHNPNWELRTFEIGYWLRATAEGQGIMSETVRSLTDFALDALQANRVEIVCDASNERSSRVAERAGFTLEGRLRNALPSPSGNPVDCLVFSVVPEDRQSFTTSSPAR
jgi:ribosomal-protein-serine acetyltransferase